MKLPWQLDDDDEAEDLDENSPWSPEAQNASLRAFKAQMGSVPAPPGENNS